MKINCFNEEKKCLATAGHFQGLLCYFCIAVRLFLIPGVKEKKKVFCFFKWSGTTWHVTSEVFSTVLQKRHENLSA